MKRPLALSIAITLLFVSCILAETEEHSYKPKDGYIPDAATAIKVAEAVSVPIYGAQVINEEKPLKAELKDDVWVVEGTLHCPEGQSCLSGVAVIEISKENGTILRVSHGK